MSYATRGNLEALFGINNVKKWADLDNSEVDADILARITVALSNSDALINDRLRDGPYSLPFTGTIPLTVVDMACKLAGVWLYESRGVQDFNPETGQPSHRLAWHKTDVEMKLRDLMSGRLSLDLGKSSRLPEIVKNAT